MIAAIITLAGILSLKWLLALAPLAWLADDTYVEFTERHRWHGNGRAP